MKDLPTDVLRTFVTVVEKGGFTLAADSLGLTQPTVSQQIKKLESLLGVTLIARGTRSQEVTSEGQALLDYAKRILMLNDEAVYSLTRPEVSGSLKIGIPHEFTMSVLPELVGVFSQTHPNIVIEIECELSKNLLATSEQYDLVVALHDLDTTREGVLLRREPLRWVCSLDDNREEPTLDIVAAPAPCIYRSHMQHALQQAGINWNLRLSSSSYDAICAGVRSGLGYTVLAESVIPGGMKKLLPESEPHSLPDVELRLHFDATVASAAANRFVEFARSNVAKAANAWQGTW